MSVRRVNPSAPRKVRCPLLKYDHIFSLLDNTLSTKRVDEEDNKDIVSGHNLLVLTH